eukprot:6336502-Amphidinium_carterae.1
MPGSTSWRSESVPCYSFGSDYIECKATDWKVPLENFMPRPFPAVKPAYSSLQQCLVLFDQARYTMKSTRAASWNNSLFTFMSKTSASSLSSESGRYTEATLMASPWSIRIAVLSLVLSIYSPITITDKTHKNVGNRN